jgi:hypothetical protein
MTRLARLTILAALGAAVPSAAQPPAQVMTAALAQAIVDGCRAHAAG